MTSLRRDLPLALAALFLWCTGAWAQEHVGDALRIDRSVSAAQGSAVRNLDTGGAVRRTDVLQSDASGRASLQFVDETIVTMGPASSLDVARITLRSDRRATEFVVDAAKGAFRCATGKSSHDAYRVGTGRSPARHAGARPRPDRADRARARAAAQQDPHATPAPPHAGHQAERP